MPKAKLTKRSVDAARHVGAGNQTIYQDSELKGFSLRVTAGGAKSFVVEYRDAARRKRRLTVGAYGPLTVDEARDLAKGHLYGLAKGDDPMEQRRRAESGETLADVGERYLADLLLRAETGARRGRLSSWTFACGLWKRHVPVGMKRRKVAELSVEDVRRLHRKLAETPATADHLRMLLHAVLEQARIEGLRPDNPAAAVKRFSKPPQRRRALTLAELGRLGAVLREVEATGKVTVTEKGEGVERSVTPAAALAIRLLSLTGMRRSELIGHMTKSYRGPREGLRWADVDLDGGSYTLASEAGGSGGKGGGPRTLPLGRPVVELLRGVRPADPEFPVVPSPQDPTAPLVGIDKPRRLIYRAAGIERADLHSLRHTFESIAFQEAPAFAGALTGRAAVRDPVLNSYIHPDQDRLREVADRVTGRIAAALDGKIGGEVVPFKRSRRGAVE